MQTLVLGGFKHNKVCGPLGATMGALLTAGWKMPGPDHWIVENGEQEAVLKNKPGDTEQILRALKTDIEERLWIKAASHHLGAGLEKGTPSFEGARRARQHLVKTGLFKEAGALDAVICGGAWHDGRSAQSRTCFRCGGQDDPWHRYWACPKLRTHDREEVCKTNHLSKTFLTEHHWAKCLWGRAILPMSLGRYKVQPKMQDDVSIMQTANLDEVAKRVEVIGTDGSGGLAYLTKEARKMGCAVVQVDGETSGNGKIQVKDLSIQIAELPGKQTVPRAELWAAILANRLGKTLERGCSVTHSDSLYTVRGANRECKSTLMEGSNGDLWRIQQGEQDNSQRLEKVKAHNEAGVLNGNANPYLFLVNALADASAEVSAWMNLNTLHEQELSKWESIQYCVALRLAIIEAEVWEYTPKRVLIEAEDVPLPEVPSVDEEIRKLHSQIRARGHILAVKNKFIVCQLCRRRRAPANYRQWADLDCVTKGASQIVAECDAKICNEGSTPTAQPEMKLVTLAEKRKIMEQRKSAVRNNRLCRAANEAQAMRAERSVVMQRIVTALPSEPVPVPFQVHKSHDCVTCGGYAACMKCGASASCAMRGNALGKECRGIRPKGGTAHRLERLLWGKHPRTGMNQWPDGSTEPRPKRLRVG